jgi:hypothetical protein
MTPVVFNEHIITGISLQPFHYDEFVTSYCVLIAAIIGWRVLFVESRLAKFANSDRALFWIAIVCIAYGVNSASGVSRAALNDNAHATRLFQRCLREAIESLRKSTVFHERARASRRISYPVIPAVLWAVHMSVFAGSQPAELKDSFYQYLYFSGATSKVLEHYWLQRTTSHSLPYWL